MLTPIFKVNQDDKNIIINIKAPFAKIAESEVSIESNVFKFFSPPYFLRLHFPGKLQENGQETAKYDADKGEFEIIVPKETHGECFQGLEMLTKLLTPSNNVDRIKPKNIEILTEDNLENNEELDWNWEQEIPIDDIETLTGECYGFNDQYKGIFIRLQEEIPEAIDVREPDSKSRKTRMDERICHEDQSFNDDHYLADLYEDDIIQEILSFKPEKDKMEFTEEDRLQLMNLPKRNYIIDQSMTHSIMFGLVDILFSFCYDRRTTFGEGNAESSWTICKLSSTLSWLHKFQNLKEVLISGFRRSLCYPLYRNFDLSQAILNDLKAFLKMGAVPVLKSLLTIHKILSKSESYYIVNELYITDYLVWAQRLSDEDLSSLCDAIEKISLGKDDLNLDLLELEAAAKIAVDEQKKESSEKTENSAKKLEEIEEKMKRLEMAQAVDSDDD